MIARPVERSGRERVFGSSTVAETKPQRIAQALLTLHGGDGFDNLARGDVVPRMPVDFRESSRAEFLGDRLAGTRAGDASAHGVKVLPEKSRAR